MASRGIASIAFLLSLNMLFFAMVSSAGSCPTDVLKLRVCNNVAGIIQIPPNAQCCSLIDNLVDLDAAVCLCTAIRANVLGIRVNIPLDLSLLLNNCAKKVPSGFQCP